MVVLDRQDRAARDEVLAAGRIAETVDDDSIAWPRDVGVGIFAAEELAVDYDPADRLEVSPRLAARQRPMRITKNFEHAEHRQRSRAMRASVPSTDDAGDRTYEREIADLEKIRNRRRALKTRRVEDVADDRLVAIRRGGRRTGRGATGELRSILWRESRERGSGERSDDFTASNAD